MIVSELAFCPQSGERMGVWTELRHACCPPQMFLSAILSFILYTLVFLRMRGSIVVNGLYIRFRLAKNENWRGRVFAQSYALRIARQMLLYVFHPTSTFNRLISRVQVPGTDERLRYEW